MNINFHRIKRQVEDFLGEIVSMKDMPSQQNYISCIETPRGRFIVKIYEQRSPKANPNREIQMSKLLRDVPGTREMIYFDESKKQIPYAYAIFRYVEGETLRSLIEARTLNKDETDKIAKQIHALIKSIVRIPTQNFGRLDESGIKGTSESWVKFLRDSQVPTIETFKNTPIIPPAQYLSAMSILDKHAHKFSLTEPKLLPMDLNISNIIVSSGHEIRIIDLKTFWSGDPLCAFSQFYALTNGTDLGKGFTNEIEDFGDNEFKIRFYALLDNLSVLAFIARNNSNVARDAKPWGNPNKFSDLIAEHISYLEAH